MTEKWKIDLLEMKIKTGPGLENLASAKKPNHTLRILLINIMPPKGNSASASIKTSNAHVDKLEYPTLTISEWEMAPSEDSNP